MREEFPFAQQYCQRTKNLRSLQTYGQHTSDYMSLQ